ncbi:hypothetical protein [Pedobacter aquatilis]|uniref:hypothetical protein n=1 Tax=Pedobacter aquatilis TaxID=351343 RepID=UPI002931299C|nr:hypothetical protein [Pedobacter aquatilis]
MFGKGFGLAWAEAKKNVVTRITNSIIIINILLLILVIRKLTSTISLAEILLWVLLIGYDIYLSYKYFGADRYKLILKELDHRKLVNPWMFYAIYSILPALLMLYLFLPAN